MPNFIHVFKVIENFGIEMAVSIRKQTYAHEFKGKMIGGMRE
jgi:hypothetical protein